MQAWKRETGLAATEKIGQPWQAGGAVSGGVVQRTEGDSGLTRKVVTKTTASSEEVAEINNESEKAEVESADTPAALDGKTAAWKGKETVAVAKSVDLGGNGEPKIERKAPGVVRTVVMGEPKSAAVVANRSVVPVKLPEKPQNRPVKGLQPKKITGMEVDRPVTAGAIVHDAPPETVLVAKESVQGGAPARVPDRLQNQTVKGLEPRKTATGVQVARPATVGSFATGTPPEAVRVANEIVQGSVPAKVPGRLQNQTAKGLEPKMIAAAAHVVRPAAAAKIANSVAQKPARAANETAASRSGKARTEPASVESGVQRETPTTAIHTGAPTSRENFADNSWRIHGVPLSTAVVVPAPTSNHPVAGPERAEARLDGARMAEESGGTAPQVLASGPARLDVGVFDGTHGWLRIRAELGAGGAVNASLTASAAAHETLRAVLPEMANYLQSEAVSVSRIALHRAAAGANAMAATGGQQNDGAQRHGAAGEQAQTGDGSPKKNLRVTAQRETGSTSAASQNATRAWNGGAARSMETAGLGFGYSGGWLNVCA